MGVHFDVVMGNNVAADNTVVNVYIDDTLPPWPSRPAPTTTATSAPRCSRRPSARSPRAAGRAVAARARAPGRRQPRRPAPPLRRQAGAARRARRGRLRAPRPGELRAALAAAGDGFDARLLAFARAYVHFATEHAALLELMFAGKHRPGAADSLRAGRRPRVRGPARADRRGPGDRRGRRRRPRARRDRRLRRAQGIAAMANSQMLGDVGLDESSAAAVERLVLGLRPR